MSVCIFVGPTLAAADARGVLEATYLPPVKQGDVHRAVALLRPRAVGIIDGYFQWVPSVWHKEILWAIDRGVHVFGAASMGALRAAELAPFGMHGVGRIFEAYRDGVLDCCPDEPFEDDDEVAVEHGPGEIGYVATSEAMVNIRCTLAQAQAHGVISAATRARCLGLAKALFFPERSYDALLACAREHALPAAELAALEKWLPTGRANQKRADALAMLATMRDFVAANPPPARAAFAFEHTTLWERALADNAPASLHDGDETRVLAELRLDGARFDALRRELAQPLAAPAVADADGLLAQRLAECREQPHEVERLIEDATRCTALARAFDDMPPALIERQVLARMRDSEEFARLLARAADKQTRIAAQADLPDADEFTELQLLQLRDWYFTQVLGEDMPDDIDARIRSWGYRDAEDFHRAIFAEHVYRRLCAEEGAAPPAAAPDRTGILPHEHR